MWVRGIVGRRSGYLCLSLVFTLLLAVKLFHGFAAVSAVWSSSRLNYSGIASEWDDEDKTALKLLTGFPRRVKTRFLMKASVGEQQDYRSSDQERHHNGKGKRKAVGVCKSDA